MLVFLSGFSFLWALVETETIPETPKILGTAKVLGGRLNTKYDRRESENLVRILLDAVLGKPYKWLLMHPEAVFTPEEFNMWEAGAERLLAGEPIQYIVGKAWFRGMELQVNSHVLIPRPETEELVEWVIEVAGKEAAWRILDVGTGSGCIALALARELPRADVTGVDVSEEAIAVAEANAKELGIACRFLLLDVLTADQSAFQELDGIVSNPPYIPVAEWEGLEAHVREHEPALALTVPDAEPLLYYNKVCKLGKTWLKPGGWAFFEVHEGFGEDVAESMKGYGYEGVEVRKDLSGRIRMVAGHQPLG
jgi:release factor glutamine methyltransferase